MNTEKIALNNEYENSIKILKQMKYNIEFMDETIRSLCTSIYYNVDAVSIMNEDNNIFELKTKFQNLNSLLVPNKFTKSIYFYNKNRNSFDSSTSGIFQNNTLFDVVIQNYNTIPVLRPVFLKNYNVTDGEQQSDSLLYFMYDSIDKSNKPNSALILNVNFSWLLDNIKMLNKTTTNKSDVFFIMNEKGEFLGDSNQNENMKLPLQKLFTEYKNNNFSFKENNGFLIKKINGENFTFSFLNIDKAGFILVKVGNYKDVFGVISKMRTSIITITLLFLVLCTVGSLTVSKKIYNPIEQLIKKVNKNQKKPEKFIEIKDEIAYLDEVYRLSSDKINTYEERILSNREALKSMFLKKLLNEAEYISEQEIEDGFNENNIKLDVYKGFALCTLKIDGFIDFVTKYNSNDRLLMKFAIINIATEIFSIEFPAEGVDIAEDIVVIMINVGKYDGMYQEFYEIIIEVVKEVQKNILNFLNISVSATISQPVSDIHELMRLYSTTLEKSIYRYVFGKYSIITNDAISENINNLNYTVSIDYKKKLEESVKLGNLNQIEELLKKVIIEISKFSYSNIMISLFHLANTVRNIIEEMNKISIKPVYSDFPDITQKILTIETLDEVYEEIFGGIRQVVVNKESLETNDKHTLLIESIKDIVMKNYYKSSLSLTDISSMLKMSSGYVGRIYKESTKMSINEYINEVRLEKAAELLMTSQQNINEMLKKIGIQNETYFYSLFKKKYGLTPKEYSLKKSLDISLISKNHINI